MHNHLSSSMHNFAKNKGKYLQIHPVANFIPNNRRKKTATGAVGGGVVNLEAVANTCLLHDGVGRMPGCTIG
jgi:hypothetical protein